MAHQQPRPGPTSSLPALSRLLAILTASLSRLRALPVLWPSGQRVAVLRTLLRHVLAYLGSEAGTHVRNFAETALGVAALRVSVRLLRLFTVTVRVAGRDKASEPLLDWIGAHALRRHDVRHYLAKSSMATNELERNTIERRPVFASTWFVHRGRPFLVERDDGGGDDGGAGSDNDGRPGDDDFARSTVATSITCIGLSAQPIEDFLAMCLAAGADANASKLAVFVWRSYYWRRKTLEPARPLSTLHLDAAVRADLLADVEKYLHPATRRRYERRGMPYRRGYLFHGPPGTGKSTLSSVLAGAYGLDLHEINIPSVLDDEDLREMFEALPARCIVLLEDIDAARVDRKSGGIASGDGAKADAVADVSPLSGATLSGLLNVLDGVGSQQGRVVIMTTNKPEALDEALTRPGRIDKKVYVGHISRECAAAMFMRMYEPDVCDRLGGLGLDKKGGDKNKGKDERRGFGTLRFLKPSRKGEETTAAAAAAAAQGVSDDAEPRACLCDLCLGMDMAQLRSLADDFAARVPEDAITPAQLQGFFQAHLDCPREARDEIEAWAAQQERTKLGSMQRERERKQEEEEARKKEDAERERDDDGSSEAGSSGASVEAEAEAGPGRRRWFGF